MRIPRVYEPVTLSEHNRITLSDNAFSYVIKVLRLREGDTIILFNGDGREYEARLADVSKRTACADITEMSEPVRESHLQIEVGQGLSRGERMDYAVQKATELGVARFVPLFTDRCEVRLDTQRSEKRQRHWQQVAISACEQCHRTRIPELSSPTTLTDWINNVEADLKLVLHHHSEQPLQEMTPPKSVALLIGPEGGLTEAEVEAAQAAGFKAVTFGPRVMRTETAPIAACAILNYLWGDFA